MKNEVKNIVLKIILKKEWNYKKKNKIVKESSVFGRREAARQRKGAGLSEYIIKKNKE